MVEARLLTRWLVIPLIVSVAARNERSFPKGWSPFKALSLPEADKMPSKAVLKQAHREKSLKWHPDKCQEEQEICTKKMQAINVANEILSNEDQFEDWKAQKHGSKPGGNSGGSGGGFGFGFGDFGDFGGGGGGHSRPQQGGGHDPFEAYINKQKAKPCYGGAFDPFGSCPAPTPPFRPPPPVKRGDKVWSIVSSEEERRGNAVVTKMTREKSLPGRKKVKVEVVEETCEEHVCTEKVLDRSIRELSREEQKQREAQEL